MHPPLVVGRELPDANALRARIEQLDAERALLRRLLQLTIRIEGRQLASSPTRPTEAANASR